MHSNTGWCSDTLVIPCLNGDKVYVVFTIDTCDREVMSYIASTIGIDGKAIRDLMVETMEYRIGRLIAAPPIQWLSDNGSCYTAKETVAFGRKLGLDIRTTPAYSPESNGIMDQLSKWIEDYNERAPHKALKMRSPRAYIKEQKLAG